MAIAEQARKVQQLLTDTGQQVDTYERILTTPDQGCGTITITVLQGGLAVTNAIVDVQVAGGRQITTCRTNSSGVCQVAIPIAASYLVSAQAGCYYGSSLVAATCPGDNPVTINLTNDASCPCNLTCQVDVGCDGETLDGFVFAVTGIGSCTTDASGHCLIGMSNPTAAANHNWTCTKTGYFTASGTIGLQCPLGGNSSQVGPIYPTSWADGGGANAWANPANAGTADGSYATATSPTNLLEGTQLAWSPPIPDNARITGILGEWYGHASASGGTDSSCKLIKSGGITSFEQAASTTIPTSDGVIDYGSSASIWGYASLTPNDLNNSAFGVEWSGAGGGGTPALVQKSTEAVIASGSPQATWPAATTAGNLLVAVLWHQDGTLTITPPAGWTLAAQENSTGRVAIYYQPNAPSRSGTVLFVTSSPTHCGMSLAEFSGIAAATPLDKTATGTTSTGTTAATTQASELLIARLMGNTSAGTPTSMTNSFGLDGAGSTGVFSSGWGHRIVSSTGTYSSALNNASVDGVIATFKGSAPAITISCDYLRLTAYYTIPTTTSLRAGMNPSTVTLSILVYACGVGCPAGGAAVTVTSGGTGSGTTGVDGIATFSVTMDSPNVTLHISASKSGYTTSTFLLQTACGFMGGSVDTDVALVSPAGHWCLGDCVDAVPATLTVTLYGETVTCSLGSSSPLGASYFGCLDEVGGTSLEVSVSIGAGFPPCDHGANPISPQVTWDVCDHSCATSSPPKICGFGGNAYYTSGTQACPTALTLTNPDDGATITVTE